MAVQRSVKRGMAAVGVGAALGMGLAVASWRRDGARRERWRRQARIWRLSSRRAAHFVATRVRGAGADQERRAALEARFAIRSAEDVAAELGDMKGAVMKLGQLLSFLADGLPPEAQAALATLQQDVPPMAPSLAEEVVTEQLGAAPEHLFLDWDPVPVAAASIGQVHRAVLRDGRLVAVKVQYPGVGDAIRHDLDNAELLYGLVSAVAMKGVDAHALVDELRDRMGDELDYALEAGHQTTFWERYRDHPFVHVPAVVPELSAERVLTTEWVDGLTFAQLEERATERERQRAAEAIFRFAQSSVHEHRVFNGDPHPGNYRFHLDGPLAGKVTFLDFGLVKRWDGGEYERLMPVLRPVLARDAPGTVAAMEDAGFLTPGHGFEPDRVFAAVSAPYRAYLDEEYEFTPAYVTEALQTVLDLAGPNGEVLRSTHMPASFVVLDRVVWGVSALLGRLRARNRWRGVLLEYFDGADPATELGRLEREWKVARGLLPAGGGIGG